MLISLLKLREPCVCLMVPFLSYVVLVVYKVSQSPLIGK
ncbi:hypothetical protein AKJ16_DCAP27721 [Drosera capensis]